MTMRGERKNGEATARLAAERDRRDRLVSELSAVVRTLDKYDEELEDVPDVAPMRDRAQTVKAESNDLLESGRLLRLGIVGQIKAGKSTLLNLLLFDGREVLPRAATPMTASLTHVVRDDAVGTDRAEIDVEFYSPEEWQQIEEHARECRKAQEAGRSPGEFLRASAEHIAMAEQLGIRVTDHAGTKTESVSIDGLNERLCNLVGADGKFTPLVKSVTIRCGREIPELDIVDTPGLNDPITSRARATQDLLARCDAVLLLSYAGQFMDSSDVKLLEDTLPGEGIRKCVVIGSKFDSALIDEAKRYPGDLEAAAEGVERQLRDRARDQIERMGADGRRVSIAAEDVLFVSAMCATLAAKPYPEWNTAERGAFEGLRTHYKDWLDSPQNGVINRATAKNLAELLGRSEQVDANIHAIHADKDKIIGEKVSDYLREKETTVRDDIESLIAELNQKEGDLRSAELEALNDRKSAVRESIDEIRDGIAGEWGNMISGQTAGLRKAKSSCREEVDTLRSAVEESIEVKQFQRKVDKKSGFLGLGWLFRSVVGAPHYEIEPYEREVMSQVSLRVATDHARDKLRSLIDDELGKMFSSEFAASAKKKLRRICAEKMDNTTASEARPSFARSLGRAVEKIAEHARDGLDTPRSVKLGESMNLHGDTQEKVSAALKYVNAIRDEVDASFKEAERIAEDVNTKAAPELLPVAIADLDKYHARLEQDLKDKAFRLRRFRMAIRDLERHRERFARADAAG